MKKLNLLLVMILLSGGIMAQQTRVERKEARKSRKEEQTRIAMENSKKLKALAETKRFVLEAHTLYDRKGLTYMLTPTTNFVGFDGKNSTIQLSFNQIVGWNGVGGITIDGKISSMELKTKENKPNFTINATVVNKGGGVTTMIFRVSSDGNARVDLSGNFGERISFQGSLVSLQDTRVYKGSPIF